MKHRPFSVIAACLTAMPLSYASAQSATAPQAQNQTEAAGSQAAMSSDPSASPQVADAESSPFRFTFAPYIWLTSVSGDVTTKGVEVDASKTFLEILDDSDRVFGLMGALELECRDFVFQLNGAWTTAEIKETVGLASGSSIDTDLELSTAWFELLGGYRFFDRALGAEDSSTRLNADIFLGGRITDVHSDANLTAATDITLPDGVTQIPAGSSAGIDQSKTWFEPFLGARASLQLSEHWRMSLRGDIGGFGVAGADFAWQVVGGFGYSWRMKSARAEAFLGYRALSQDYSDGDFAWDVLTHGPIIGAQLSWEF